jgi:hypothetical protein
VGGAIVRHLRDRRLERKRVRNDMGVNRVKTRALGERICFGEFEEEKQEHEEDDKNEDEFEDEFLCVKEEDDEDEDEFEDGFSCVKERVEKSESERRERQTFLFIKIMCWVATVLPNSQASP